MSYQIGDEIGITNDFEIESAFGGKKLQVKTGDKGFIDSRGMIHYTTGEARGKIQRLEGEEVKGYNHENIAKLLFKRIKNQFNLGEFLEGYEISDNDVIEELEDLLSDIL